MVGVGSRRIEVAPLARQASKPQAGVSDGVTADLVGRWLVYGEEAVASVGRLGRTVVAGRVVVLPEPGPKLVTGPPRMPDRQALCGILFVPHVGIQWKYVPQELGFGSGMTSLGSTAMTYDQPRSSRTSRRETLRP